MSGRNNYNDGTVLLGQADSVDCQPKEVAIPTNIDVFETIGI